MLKYSHRPLPFKAGFTLIEILAATAVMGAVMLMVLSLVSYIMGAWNRSTDNLETAGRAQFALDVIEKDLGGLELRQTTENFEFLRATTADINGPGSLSEPSTELIFLTSPVDSSSGAPQCVIYKVRFSNPLRSSGGGTRIYGLYRAKASPRATLKNAYIAKENIGDNALNTIFPGKASDGKDTSVEKDASDPNASGNLLVANVLALRITPYYFDDNGNIEAFSTRGGIPQELSSGTFVVDARDRASIVGGLTNKKLAYIDITLILITPEGSSFLSAVDNGRASGPTSWTDWLQQNTYTFTRRVPVFPQN